MNNSIYLIGVSIIVPLAVRFAAGWHDKAEPKRLHLSDGASLLIAAISFSAVLISAFFANSQPYERYPEILFPAFSLIAASAMAYMLRKRRASKLCIGTVLVGSVVVISSTCALLLPPELKMRGPLYALSSYFIGLTLGFLIVELMAVERPQKD